MYTLYYQSLIFFLISVSREVLSMYLSMYICIYHLAVIPVACLNDVLSPFQAIKNEVKLFSNKRKEIKRGIKALAKTVSVAIPYTNTFGPGSKITF